ncbi:MAG TPA: PGPGW domain-containing protein [Syntrophales bacterium]|nr:PGPGW domain-containing protein [Syntrophales bacterium]HQB30130.1 PGPGW domain-containing protein [Syntrophales bacterium]HQN78147.1 PGPGW domain-containing protein [Syntrophales bacterium]HQQ25889.1 PGPGW domain-containing protein [Syntrophales bacterium]
MLKKTAKQITGWFLVVLGVIGLFLPVLQGILFIALGLGLLAGENESIRNHLHRWKANPPPWFPKSLGAFLRRGKRDA